VAVPDIRSLSAYDLNKIQQSLNQYNKSLEGTPRPGLGRGPGFRSMTTANRERAAREPFKSGGTYGIEDEYRYMVSQGFNPKSMQVSSQTEAKPEASGETSTPKQTEVTANIPEYKPQFDTSAFEKQISGLNEQISNLTSGFQTQLETITSQMQQERADATKRMEEMQGNFAQALAARESRPRVEGIRTPNKGTGGATQQQLQRRGVSGTFGRSGDRLMKISALNV